MPRRPYINPFADEAWATSRNDQGVDYYPLKVEPIRAGGAGATVEIDPWGSYGPWFDYRLSRGSLVGEVGTRRRSFPALDRGGVGARAC